MQIRNILYIFLINNIIFIKKYKSQNYLYCVFILFFIKKISVFFGILIQYPYKQTPSKKRPCTILLTYITNKFY